MNTLTLTLVTLALVLLSGTAASQTVGEETAVSRRGFWIGVVGGGNFVSYASDKYPIMASKTCVNAYDGSGRDGFIGLAMEYPLGRHNQNVLTVQASYDSRSAEFRTTDCYIPGLESVKNGVSFDSTTYASQTANLHYWSVNLSFKHNFMASEAPLGFGLQLGPSIGYQPQPTLLKTFTTYHSSGNAASPMEVLYDEITAPAPEVNAIRLAIRGALTCDVPFSRVINAELLLGYDLPLTKVDRYSNWSTSAVFTGLSLRYFVDN